MARDPQSDRPCEPWCLCLQALYQNLLLSLANLHTTMVCLICFFIKSIMGLIEKIGSATCSLTTDLSVCRLKRVSHSSVSDTCVIGAFPPLMRTKTNINTGGASAPIDHDAMRINHLAFSSKNKIYIFNVRNVLTHTGTIDFVLCQQAGLRRQVRCLPLVIWVEGVWDEGQVWTQLWIRSKYIEWKPIIWERKLGNHLTIGSENFELWKSAFKTCRIKLLRLRFTPLPQTRAEFGNLLHKLGSVSSYLGVRPCCNCFVYIISINLRNKPIFKDCLWHRVWEVKQLVWDLKTSKIVDVRFRVRLICFQTLILIYYAVSNYLYKLVLLLKFQADFILFYYYFGA